MRVSLVAAVVLTVLVGWASLAQAAPTDRIGQGDIVVQQHERVADAVSLGGTLTVSGWVTGDAVALGGGVHLLPGARVDGDITALGGSIIVEPGAVVLGSQTGLGSVANQQAQLELPPPASLGEKSSENGTSSTSSSTSTSAFERWVQETVEGFQRFIQKIGHMIGLFGLIVVLGLIMLGVAPLRTRALAAAVAAHPGKSLGLGLVVVLGAIVAIVLLSITVIGLPLAAVFAVLIGCAAVLGLTGVSILIGELMPFKTLRDRSILKLMLGAGILVLALSIPYAGGVLGVLATMIGLGSLALTRMRPGHLVFGQRRKSNSTAASF